MILDFFSDYGLYLLDVYPISQNPYGVDAWDDIWNNPYHGNINHFPHQTMSRREFNRFMNALEDENFDKGKSEFIFYNARDVYFTAKQIQEMVSLFSFDDNKLEIAIALYPQCADKYNYYMVEDAFSFNSSKEKLRDYIMKNR